MKITEYSLGNIGKKICLLTDLHNKNPKPIIGLLQQIKPDYILVVGDVVHKDTLFNSDYAKMFLSQCVKIAPTLFSFGNHERFMAKGEEKDIRAMGVITLCNNHLPLNGLTIGGLPSALWKQPDLKWLDDFERQSGYKILMCHHPEYYEKHLKNRKIDLIVSGHAHGGQIRFFGKGLYSPGQGLFPKYTKGLYDKKLIVGAGLANTGFPPRVLNPTEIVVINI